MKFAELKQKFWPRREEPDSVIVSRTYQEVTGHPLNLKNPKSFHEKLCWIRLNGMTPLHTYCTDKLTFPAYVASRVGPGHTVPAFFRTTDPDKLSAGAVPASRCVIKPNHFSGWVCVVPDTATADWPAIREVQRDAVSRNFYDFHREIQYRPIRPAILAEEYVDQGDSGIGEIKMFYLNGIARLGIVFRPGAIPAGQEGILIDSDCRPVPVSRLVRQVTQGEVIPPANFAELRAIGEALAAPFPMVRVDFLLGREKTYVNELTFSPLAGYDRFTPESFEMEMGTQLDHRARVPSWRRLLSAARKEEAALLPPWL